MKSAGILIFCLKGFLVIIKNYKRLTFFCGKFLTHGTKLILLKIGQHKHLKKIIMTKGRSIFQF